MKRTVFCLLVASLLGSGAALAQYTQLTPNVGAVNWTDQVVRATGYGAANPNTPPGAQRAGALQAAKVVALRNLLEMVKGMNINSQTTVENAMVTSDVINTRVSGVVRNFTIVDTRYMSSGDIEVDVEVPLSSFYELFAEMPGVIPFGMAGSAPATGVRPNTVYTGLIVDARGLGARPALAPRIVDESGNEVYGSGQVSRDYAIQIGVVGYEKDLDRAAKNERVAGNPIVVKGVKASGANNADVVISDQDARSIREAGANLNFMEQCKVMVILD